MSSSSSSSSPPPKVDLTRGMCVACYERVERVAALVCSKNHHFLCSDCAASYCANFTERAKLLKHKGCVPCAGREDNENQPCSSPPFTLQQLTALQNPELVMNVLNGLLTQALAAVADPEPAAPVNPAPANPAALEIVPFVLANASLAPAPVAPKVVVPAALSAAEVKKLTLAALTQLQERCLFLACPRCKLWWDDYSGCSALQCAKSTCQQHFCAVCFARFPSSGECHGHIAQQHGGHYQHDKFLQQHKPARMQKVTEFIALLPNPLVRRQVLLESKQLIETYGLDYAALFKMFGHDVPKPPVAAAAQPLAHTDAGAPMLFASAPLNLPPADVNASIVLWLDRRIDSNYKLKSALAAVQVRVISVVSSEAAVDWILAHPRLLALAHRFRIVSNHAPRDGLTREQLTKTSAALPILQLLVDTRSAVRLLIFCGASLPAAEAFIAHFRSSNPFPPQVAATNSDEVVRKFTRFA